LEDKNPKDSNDHTPLHSVAFRGHLHIIEYLIEQIGGDINPSLSDGKTALHLAAEGGHLNVVSFYTNRLPNPNPGKLTNDKFRGRTPLHEAAQRGHLPVVQHICNLLEDKNPKDSNDATPLHLAASNGHLEVVKYLVQHVENIHPKNGVNWGEKTPLDYSIEKNHSAITNFILEHDDHLSAIARLNQVTLDENAGVACAGAQAVIEATAQSGPETVVEETLETAKEDNECTICYEPRIQTYVFIPCGHATFCKDCALHIFENTDKRCPDCRSRIQQTFRIFQ